MTKYIQRELAGITKEALKSVPVVVITGMRQTGKTTFLQNDPLFKRYQYMSLDDFATLQTALSQPETLLASENPICIDEAQKAPELLTMVKKAVDANRKAGRFVLSGSANFALLKGMSESLAGRALYLTLHPFSRRELLKRIHNEPYLVKLLTKTNNNLNIVSKPIGAVDILRGGMPPVSDASLHEASIWFRGFEQTYVERDIRDLARIDDLLGFRTVIKLAALRSGQLLNFSQLARDARLSLATVTRYLKLAETSFLFKRLPPYLRNRSSRLIKSPKLYLSDSGLAAHLADIENGEIGEDEPLRGVLYETYVLQNISSILEAHLPAARITYWHVQGRHEVDFIIEHKKQCIAIELKAATRWSERDLSSLKTFIEKTPSRRIGVLAYNGSQSAEIGNNLRVIPIGTLLS